MLRLPPALRATRQPMPAVLPNKVEPSASCSVPLWMYDGHTAHGSAGGGEVVVVVPPPPPPPEPPCANAGAAENARPATAKPMTAVRRIMDIWGSPWVAFALTDAAWGAGGSTHNWTMVVVPRPRSTRWRPESAVSRRRRAVAALARSAGTGCGRAR